MNISSVQAGHINCSHRIPKTKSERQQSDERSILDQYPAGLDLYRQVRGAFIGKGSSLTKYAEENGVKYNAVRQCLFGLNNGPNGKELRLELIEASGIKSLIEDAA